MTTITVRTPLHRTNLCPCCQGDRVVEDARMGFKDCPTCAGEGEFDVPFDPYLEADEDETEQQEAA